MTQKVKKAIFPVAGFGTRFLPATKAQPKEMLPVVDKPVIQYLVEQAAEAGVEEIIFVTGRGKRAIEDHFDYSFELDQTLVEKNKLDLVEQVRRISNLAKFSYVRQSMPLGDGHAINCARHLVDDEPVLIIFGDTLYDSAVSPVKQVLDAYNQLGGPVIGLSEVKPTEIDQFGIVSGETLADGTYKINEMIEKPAIGSTSSSLAAVGIYVITPRVFEILDQVKPGKGGEIRLADAFHLLLEKQEAIYGKKIVGEWLDTGSKLGLIKATIKLGLKNKEIGDDLKKFLQGIV